MKKISLFIYSLILFLVIYNPPIKAGLSFTTIAVLLSVLICIFNGGVFGRIIRIPHVKTLFKMVIGFLIYDVLVCEYSYSYTSKDLVISTMISDIVSHVSICLVSCGLVVFALSKKWDLNRFCLTYVIAGAYQAILGVICLVSPAVKSYFTALTIANSNSDKIRRTAEYFMYIRNFGFASILYDIFGMAMSVLAVLAVNQGLKGDKKYYMVAALISFAAIINSRTSFFLIAVGIIIMLLSRGGKRISAGWLSQRILFFVIAIVGIGSLFTWLLGNANTEQLEWLATALTDSQSMMEGEKIGYFDALVNSFLIFPKDFFSVVFGTGMTPADAINHNSDVGYIQYIWKHGIIGSILLYMIFIKLFKYAKIGQQWPNSTFITALFVMVAIYLIKLTCLGYSMASVIFVPICLYMIANNNKNKIKLYHNE